MMRMMMGSGMIMMMKVVSIMLIAISLISAMM